jgi:hypothetical protein
MADSDELVTQFLAFTGSVDTDRAVSYLEMSNGNLETAVGLYLLSLMDLLAAAVVKAIFELRMLLVPCVLWMTLDQEEE